MIVSDCGKWLEQIMKLSKLFGLNRAIIFQLKKKKKKEGEEEEEEEAYRDQFVWN